MLGPSKTTKSRVLRIRRTAVVSMAHTEAKTARKYLRRRHSSRHPAVLNLSELGVAAALGPKLLPAVGSLLRPVVKTAVRAGYATAVATRGVVAEAGEQFQDLVAEARADTQVSSSNP